jgi:hypothetical protein
MGVSAQTTSAVLGTPIGTSIFEDNNGNVIGGAACYDNGASSLTIGNASSCDTVVAVDVGAASGGGGGFFLFRRDPQWNQIWGEMANGW